MNCDGLQYSRFDESHTNALAENGLLTVYPLCVDNCYSKIKTDGKNRRLHRRVPAVECSGLRLLLRYRPVLWNQRDLPQCAPKFQAAELQPPCANLVLLPWLMIPAVDFDRLHQPDVARKGCSSSSDEQPVVVRQNH